MLKTEDWSASVRREAVAPAPASLGRVPALLKPGRNCWRVENARRASVLVDAATYFAELEVALRRAERSVFIIGWDFDASIRLQPDREESLADLLRGLVESRPELEVRILIWNLSTVHAPGATVPLVFGAPWLRHPRIQLRLDHRHPIYGAQHQKIVTIDDSLAFVGGIDLTVQRWDTNAHDPDDARRVDGTGCAYTAVHDMQMLVEGDAAAAVAVLARERWQVATDEKAQSSVPRAGLWPARLKPDFVDTPVAIARTLPPRGRRRGVREIRALNMDALAAARRTIYIETQYFADRAVGRLLAAQLRKSDGPEVLVVVARSAHGFLERWIMDGNRDRVIRTMKRADRFGRLRVVYPIVAAADREPCEIFVHAKLMIVDDVFLRVGSSNLNRRSTGLDAECDLAIEATDARTRSRIAEIRARLLGEHLGVSPATVTETLAREGSLLKAVDALNRNARRLDPHMQVSRHGPTHLMFGTRLLDPRGPLRLASLFGGKRPQAQF